MSDTERQGLGAMAEIRISSIMTRTRGLLSMTEAPLLMLAVLSNLAYVVVGTMLYVETLPNTHYWTPLAWTLIWAIAIAVPTVLQFIHWVRYMRPMSGDDGDVGQGSNDHSLSVHTHFILSLIVYFMPLGRFWSFLAKYGTHISPFASMAPLPMVIYSDWLQSANLGVYMCILAFLSFVYYGIAAWRPETLIAKLTGAQYEKVAQAVVAATHVDHSSTHVLNLRQTNSSCVNHMMSVQQPFGPR